MMIVVKNLARESSFRHFITNGEKRLLPNQLSWQDETKDFTCAWGFKATSIRVSGKLKTGFIIDSISEGKSKNVVMFFTFGQFLFPIMKSPPYHQYSGNEKR